METYVRFRYMTVLLFWGLLVLAVLAFSHGKLCDANSWHWLFDCSGKESEVPSPFVIPSSLEELFKELLTTLSFDSSVIQVPTEVTRVVTEVEVKEIEVTRIVVVTSETDRYASRQTVEPASTPFPATDVPTTIEAATKTSMPTPTPTDSLTSNPVPSPVPQTPTTVSSPTQLYYRFNITADTGCEHWSIQAVAIPNDAQLTYEPAQSGHWNENDVITVVVTAQWSSGTVRMEPTVLHRPEGCQNATPTPTSALTPVPTNTPTATPTATASNTPAPTPTSTVTSAGHDLRVTGSVDCWGWEVEAVARPEGAFITYDPAQSGQWNQRNAIRVIAQAQWLDGTVRTERIVLHRPDYCGTRTATPTPTATRPPTSVPSRTPMPVPSYTPTPAEPPAGTATATYVPSSTPLPTPTPTGTPGPATVTPTFTPTATVATPGTPAPTQTSTAVPTSTRIHSTPTPTPPGATATLTPKPPTPTATATQPNFSCPLEYVEGRIVVLFGGENIRSDKREDDAKVGPLSVTIPAGNYTVTLVSYDNHSGGASSSQPKESWHMILNNQDGLIVATTGSISDLPDDQDWLIEVVSDDLELEEGATSVVAVHSAYPDQNPNSVVPVCAAFDE